MLSTHEKAVAETLKDRFVRFRVQAAKTIDFSKTFSDHVVQYHILTEERRYDIMSKPVHLRASEALDILATRSDKHRLLFTKALIETEQLHVLEEILQLKKAEISIIKRTKE